MFETIEKLQPYFRSIRQVKTDISLDLQFPATWKFEDITKPYSSIKIKVQDKNDQFTLLSLMSVTTKTGYDVVFSCANEIITYNKEEEEKQKLFQQKVKELQELFKNESLEKLKEINLLDNYGQEITTRDGVVNEGDEER